jgi:hypothetical protein
MARRSTSGRPAVYVVYRDSPGTGAVCGTLVSCPGDLHRDLRRLFGPGSLAVSWSAAPAALRRLARRADLAGLPVARPLR